MDKTKNGGNAPNLEVVEVVLVQCRQSILTKVSGIKYFYT